MKDFNIFSNAWCNQVFDGRNQNYGAYQLRKSADENTLNGFIVSVCFSAASLSFPLILTLFSPKEKPEAPPIEYTLADFKTIIDIEKPKAKEIIRPSLGKKFDENALPVIIDSTDVPMIPNPPDDSNTANALSVDTTGSEASVPFSRGAITTDIVDTIVYPPVGLEINPEFPGGDKGLVNFFRTNIRFPGDAFDRGNSGTVFISFLINKSGCVSEATVLKGVPGTPSFENEALRVVKLMPAWSPGKQNGKPVMVRYTVPVRFRLE